MIQQSSLSQRLLRHQTNNIRNPENPGNAERIAIKEEIHARIFQATLFTPDQSPQGIEKKATEIQQAIQKAIGPGDIQSIQYTGKGHYTVELKSKEQVQQIFQTGLKFAGETQNAPLKPRRNQALLITIKTDASTLNQEIYEELSKFGKIVNINYGYYNNNNQIRDGRRLIHIIPTLDIDKIPHTINIDNRVHILYYRGKTTKPTQQNTQATQELLADLDISDSEEMSQDKEGDEDEDEPEQTDNPTVKKVKKTTNPTGDEKKEEKQTAVKKMTKHLSTAKPKPKSDTNSKQRPQVQNNLQTLPNAPPSTDAKLTLLAPAETETETDTKMETEQAKTETNKTDNPQKKAKRKSVMTPTKETKLNPIKTKRKPNRSET